MHEKKTETLHSVQQIRINEYNYPLPDERIAKFPLIRRDLSRLLVYKNGRISESVFNHLPDLLPAGSLIVFNNTRVIRARLLFAKDTGARIDVFCLAPEEPCDYALNFQSRRQCRWTCLAGNLKRWREGTLRRTFTIAGTSVTLTAERLSSCRQTHSILFRWETPTGREFTFADILEAAGQMPLPPYLHRDAQPSDLQTYQTVYSKINGSVAAPTAGLHFTPEVLDSLSRNGFTREEVTLHVGAGTFKPVQTETIGGHEMHTEYIAVDRPLVRQLITHAGRITAVGTTSVRTLESLYHIGALLAGNPGATPETLTVKQWQPYDATLPPLPTEEALQNILNYLDRQNLDRLIASTQIFIVPGYRFRIVNHMITNFHQPESTLLLLVSAFTGGDWRKIYDYALRHNFRFLSYGDSSLFINA
jgi:S-adenosylmethionine:tRNA ribosyltransferase-isomerase